MMEAEPFPFGKSLFKSIHRHTRTDTDTDTQTSTHTYIESYSNKFEIKYVAVEA